MGRRGFTLTEVLVTVSIIGILAAIAIPNYSRAVERSYWRQAQDLLLTIYAGERSYYFVNNKYCDVTSGPCTWNDIYVENPSLPSIPVTFTANCFPGCSGPPPPGFLAVATRIGGPCNGSTLQIDETRTLFPPGPPPCWCGAC